jgi:hypothetical protein
MAVVAADVVAATADATAGNLPVYASSKKGGNRMVAPLFAPNAILTYWSDEVPCICNGLHCTTTPAHFKFCISRSCELTVIYPNRPRELVKVGLCDCRCDSMIHPG